MKTTFPHLWQRAASDDSQHKPSKQTLIIIIVCVLVGTVILLALLYRTIRSRRSRNVAPLPPIQPLVHEREHRLAKFNADARAQSVYDSERLVVPSPPALQPGSPSLQGSQTSLLGHHARTADLSRQTSYTQNGEGSPELGSSASAGVESKSLDPKSPSPPIVLNHSSSYPHTNIPAKQTRAPFPQTSRSLSQLNNDMQSSSTHLPHSHFHRPSSASSSANTGSRRGLPHDPESGICVLLPAPLSAGIETNIMRQSVYGVAHHRSVVDGWVSTGRLDKAQ